MTLLLILLFTQNVVPVRAAAQEPPKLKIVKDELRQRSNFYYVTGTVYNPSDKGVKNVLIKYYIWKKWMGKDGHGSRIRETGGLIVASLKFIPPKQSVDFTTAPSDNAPVMTPESG